MSIDVLLPRSSQIPLRGSWQLHSCPLEHEHPHQDHSLYLVSLSLNMDSQGLDAFDDWSVFL